MADANLEITFSAATDDVARGVAAVQDALSDLATTAGQMNGQYANLGAAITAAFSPDELRAFDAALVASASIDQSLAAAHRQAAQAMSEGDEAAYADAVRAAKLAVNEEVKAVEDGLKQKLALLSEEAGRHEITEQQKVTLSRQAVDEEYQAELALLQKELAIGDLTLTQKQQIDDKILEAERQHQDEMAKLVQKSLDDQQQRYVAFGDAITASMNSQLSGLIRGTTNWQTAFKNILDDLLVKFIEWGETMVVRHLANEAAQTSATAAGVAARTGAEQAGASASLAAQGATMIRSILSSAAESFAGVFGFLSPIMGPLAAGPAAAAQATVAGMAGAVASADIGMWRVPQDMLAMIHHDELVMPAQQAGAFRNLLSGGADADANGPARGRAVHIHPTANFQVSAIDSGSVAQWMKNNGPQLARAMNDAARHGALLGLRRLAGG